MSTLRLVDDGGNILAEIIYSDKYVTSVKGSVTEAVGFAVITGPVEPEGSGQAVKPDDSQAYKPDDSLAGVPNE